MWKQNKETEEIDYAVVAPLSCNPDKDLDVSSPQSIHQNKQFCELFGEHAEVL